ncbi:MAG TPA: M56 family metallopeptidase, partial [Rhodanobacteraceae bacterium]|nr:M56 family metallopeptidase [Rhodanobacteraceae bacterium]
MLDILLEAALRATLIAATALGTLWLLRVRAAAVRHRVWTVVMVAMLALPLAIAWAPDVSLPVLPPAYSDAPRAVAAPPSDSVGVTVTAAEPATSDAVELMPAPSWSWRAWVLAIYLAGAAALLARLGIGTVRVYSLAREATVVNGLLTSARIATPFTFGLLKPRILLPEGWDQWSATRLAVVLDHERAHLARRDPLVRYLALLNRAVFWFHPLAWWLERRLAALAEEACDAAVLARGHGTADYSGHLLELARMAGRRRMPHLIGTPMLGSALPARIARILDGGIGRPGSRSAAAGAAALATLAAAVLGTFTLAQEPVAPPRAQAPAAPPRAQEPAAPTRAQQPAAPPRAQEPAPPRRAQQTAAPRNLLEVYQVALANDPIVRRAGAEYRALIDARPQARSAIAQATADYEAAREELVIRVAEPYFGVVAAESTLAFQEAARAALARQFEQASRRFEVGLIAITDVQESRGRFDQSVANALTARHALAGAEDALREVVGEPVGRLRALVEDLPLEPPDPSNAEAWIEMALQRNPVLV